MKAYLSSPGRPLQERLSSWTTLRTTGKMHFFPTPDPAPAILVADKLAMVTMWKAEQQAGAEVVQVSGIHRILQLKLQDLKEERGVS